MKILFFEGLDNLGKSTLAKKFVDKYSQKYNILFMHSRYPDTDEDPLNYQYQEFVEKVMMIKSCYEQESRTDHPLEETLVIMDRSWIDEYVYGQIYRNETPDDIKQLIDTCFLLLREKNMQKCIVHLISSVDLSICNDDSKSFTSNLQYNDKKVKVELEHNLFTEISKYCEERNYCSYIEVNVESVFTKNGKPTFKNISDIFNNTIKLLGDKNIIL